MTTRVVVWFIAPGFTLYEAQRAAADFGFSAPRRYDEIKERKRKGWRRIFVEIRVTGGAVV